jgi:hypothetical protein
MNYRLSRRERQLQHCQLRREFDAPRTEIIRIYSAFLETGDTALQSALLHLSFGIIKYHKNEICSLCAPNLDVCAFYFSFLVVAIGAATGCVVVRYSFFNLS